LIILIVLGEEYKLEYSDTHHKMKTPNMILLPTTNQAFPLDLEGRVRRQFNTVATVD
jgi:hypothetical protein